MVEKRDHIALCLGIFCQPLSPCTYTTLSQQKKSKLVFSNIIVTPHPVMPLCPGQWRWTAPASTPPATPHRFTLPVRCTTMMRHHQEPPCNCPSMQGARHIPLPCTASNSHHRLLLSSTPPIVVAVVASVIIIFCQHRRSLPPCPLQWWQCCQEKKVCGSNILPLWNDSFFLHLWL